MALFDREMAQMCPTLDAFASPLKKAERPIIGRDEEMRAIRAALMRPELCNIILLAEAGSGKTALVQGLMEKDKDRVYLEVDPAKMLAGLGDKNEMASRIKSLFDDTARLVENSKQEVVLFIDEFHQIVQLSDAAVEALKPMLADSGTRGIRVVAATTYVEFRRHIAPNQPLVERLQRFNLKQPGKDVVVSILKGMAQRYGVSGQFCNNKMFELIYEYTERYIPANSQPRKSILLMDNMIGWHRAEGRKINQKLLADVIYATEGINVAFRVDARSIKKELDAHVFAQELATNVIEQRLQICIADLNNHDKPMSSFLFTGSTGVGKSVISSTKIPYYDRNGKIFWKRISELVVGDWVFGSDGKPVEVVGVYPQGELDAYELEFDSGRTIICNGEHIWKWCPTVGKAKRLWQTSTLSDMIKYLDEHPKQKLAVPICGEVEYPEANLKVHPYVMGAMIGDGSLTSAPLRLCTDDDYVAAKVAKLIGASSYKRTSDGGSEYYFYTGCMAANGRPELFRTVDLFGDYPEVFGLLSHEKRIPSEYMTASVSQRWSLLQGLMDTDGGIHDDGHGQKRFQVTYATTSYLLAEDVRLLLLSLGIQSRIQPGRDTKEGRKHTLYFVYPSIEHSRKPDLFTLPRRKDVALKAADHESSLSRIRKYDKCVIRSIRKLDYKVDMTCIAVDSDDHLYLAGQYIVTHNTEVTKQLAKLLFNDERNLIRLDMTEFALPESMERFRAELTNRVWERPYSIVLLDEIEKACAPVTRLLLQVLDDGRLVDENNREVTFKNCYVIMTTNAGSEIYKKISQYAVDNRGSGEHIMKYMKLIKRSIAGEGAGGKFPPELLGRIDCVVPFQPLSEETMKRIVEGKIRKLIKNVAERHNVKLRVSKDVIRYLIIDGMDTDSDSGGARAVVSKLESEVTMAVARFINAHPGIETIEVSVEGEMAADNLHKLESDAYIKVTAVS